MEKCPVLKNKKDFDEFIAEKSLTLVHFSVSWSDACKQLETILNELKQELKCFKVASVDAEGIPDISVVYQISAAPTLLFFKAAKEVDRHNGFNPTEIRNKILKYSFVDLKLDGKTEKESSKVLESRIKNLINKSRLMLFMKGTPEVPRCGFSRQMVELLDDLEADYGTFDILEDEEIRQGLKKYSNWPTYPQLYLDGELLGGLDVVREEIKNLQFVDKLPKRKTM